jgi:uncharacterized Zn-binding protein involved in type VI secretion
MRSTHSTTQPIHRAAPEAPERKRYGALSFEPPDRWKGREILIYEGPSYVPGGPPTSIVFMREEREPGETFLAHALQGLVGLSKRAEGVKLIETAELKVGGRHAMRAHYVTSTARGELEQVLIYVDAPGDVTVTMTCSAMAADERPWLAALERLLDSTRFASESPDAPAEPRSCSAKSQPVTRLEPSNSRRLRSCRCPARGGRPDMPEQGRVGDRARIPRDSHDKPCCPHDCKGPATSGSPNVFVNGRKALRVTDPGKHETCCGPNKWKAAAGSATVVINGLPAHRKDDRVKHCGGNGKLIEGSPNVIVGGPQTG